MLITTLVSTFIRDADGKVPRGAMLEATLVDANNVPIVQFDGGAVVPPRVRAPAAPGDGYVEIPLWPNSRGQGGSMYRLTFTNAGGLMGPPVFCAVPESPQVALDAIVGLAPFPPISALLGLLSRTTTLERQVRDGSALDVTLLPQAVALQAGDLALIFRDGQLYTAPAGAVPDTVPAGALLVNGGPLMVNGGYFLFS